MSVTIQKRRDSAATFTAVNPVLAQGEEAYETDTGKQKRGDGTTAWVSLPYRGETIGVVVTGTPTAGQVPTATSGTAATWQTPTGGGGAPSGAAGGDLSGTYPNPGVAKIAGVAVTGVPTSGQVPTASSGTAAAWATPAAPASATTTTQGIVQLAGDLAGTAAAPTVAKISGVAVTGVPTSGQVPIASSGTAAAWGTPSGGADATTSSKGVVELAGDLGGTAASPSVLKINTVAVTAGAAAGQVLQATGSVNATWGPVPIQKTVPSDCGGLKIWNYDPAGATGTFTPTAGTLYLCRIDSKTALTLTNLYAHVTTAGATLTASQNFIALYSNLGVLVDSIDMTSAYATVGDQQGVLATGGTTTVAGWYVGILCNGTTMPVFAAGASATGGVGMALETPGGARFRKYNTTGLTALPGTVGTSGTAFTKLNSTIWVAAN